MTGRMYPVPPYTVERSFPDLSICGGCLAPVMLCTWYGISYDLLADYQPPDDQQLSAASNPRVSNSHP